MFHLVDFFSQKSDAIYLWGMLKGTWLVCEWTDRPVCYSSYRRIFLKFCEVYVLIARFQRKIVTLWFPIVIWIPFCMQYSYEKILLETIDKLFRSSSASVNPTCDCTLVFFLLTGDSPRNVPVFNLKVSQIKCSKCKFVFELKSWYEDQFTFIWKNSGDK